MSIDPDFWAGRRVLLTGHTGFKGAWLSLWLQALGARVIGLAPGVPTSPSLYELAGIGAGMEGEHAVDVRDAEGVRAVLREARAEVVLHLAAQPMVRRSLRDPALTYAVNMIGTVNVLEAVRVEEGDVGAVVVVTSDKCYENPENPENENPENPENENPENPENQNPKGGNLEDPSLEDPSLEDPSLEDPNLEDPSLEDSSLEDPNLGGHSRRFVEEDPLGGSDPYSSSKACAELITAAYRRSFFSAPSTPRIASARAGNVIGGGDWGEDRLIGDVVRGVQGGEVVKVRNPEAVRPWQHVLNPLSGYLRLGEELWRSRDAAQAWNFGPQEGDAQTVRWILELLERLWGGAFSWELDGGENPPEAGRLELDSSKAQRHLGWHPQWDLGQALERVVQWHEAQQRGEDMRRVSLRQIEQFG